MLRASLTMRRPTSGRTAAPLRPAPTGGPPASHAGDQSSDFPRARPNRPQIRRLWQHAQGCLQRRRPGAAFCGLYLRAFPHARTGQKWSISRDFASGASRDRTGDLLLTGAGPCSPAPLMPGTYASAHKRGATQTDRPHADHRARSRLYRQTGRVLIRKRPSPQRMQTPGVGR
jgi:hypothetical protein